MAARDKDQAPSNEGPVTRSAPGRAASPPAGPRKASGKPEGKRGRTTNGTRGPAPKRPPRAPKEDAEIVLLCNPQAGGRWKELAAILDSEEARSVRRIVTDSVNDVGPALAALGRESALLFIYGGDGTIQRILDRMSPIKTDDIRLALIGGGTMNVTARWCGMTPSPVENFRSVIHAYRTGHLLLKEVPLLEVRCGERVHRGFTFGMGPIVRVLDHYERGRKGKTVALTLGVKTLLSIWTGYPPELSQLVAPMPAEVLIDGERVEHAQFMALFANVTGQINPGVEPFTDQRSRDTFFCAAYAVSPREMSLAVPGLLRGWLPLDTMALLRPLSLPKRLSALLRDRRLQLDRDPRYINRPARRFEIRTEETLFTVDGELMHAPAGELIQVELGPTLKLAVSPLVALEPAVRLAAGRALRR